jgi:putative tryptophan/tyrosine transport system substrate-binding protein
LFGLNSNPSVELASSKVADDGDEAFCSGACMRRRAFLGILGGTVVTWPVAARAQQAAMPVIGFLNSLSEQAAARHQVQFRRGLGEVGFVQGRNVAIEHRWADGQYEKLPAMAAELVRRAVDVIVAQAPPAAVAARAATSTIPIVFAVGIDPVAAGLVASYNRPGGNATGTTLISGPLGQKRLEILREIVPRATTVALVVNPQSPDAPPEIRDVQAAAQAIGLQVRLFNASTRTELEAAFKALEAQRPDGLLMGGDPFFLVQSGFIIDSIARLGLVAVHPFREFADAGGLISYGTNIAATWRQVGIYAGRILKGANPADLPVMQPTTFELVINLKTARSQGIDISPNLHARSDEVIE